MPIVKTQISQWLSPKEFLPVKSGLVMTRGNEDDTIVITCEFQSEAKKFFNPSQDEYIEPMFWAFLPASPYVYDTSEIMEWISFWRR